MNQRPLRITVKDVVVTFTGTPAFLVNVSRNGALLSTLRDIPAGFEGPLWLTVAGHTTELNARVVRSKVDGSARGAEMESWLVAPEFIGVEPDVVSKALRLLLG